MQYLRVMRSKPDYNPQLRHCMYGTDADLILLALVSFEPYFSILREETLTMTAFKTDRKDIPQPFQLLHIPIIREYLRCDFESYFPEKTFDINRLVDDLTFMMCLVGNDFLPNLPNISIAEHGLELMFSVYQNHIRDLGGYIMDGSVPNLPRLVKFLNWLAEPDQKGAGDTPNFEAFDLLNQSEQEQLRAFDFADYDDSDLKVMPKLDGLDFVMEGDEEEEDEESTGLTQKIGALTLDDAKKKIEDPETKKKSEAPESEKKSEDPESGKKSEDLEEPSKTTTIDYFHQPGAPMREPYYTTKLGGEASLKNSEYHMKMCKAYLDGISWVIRYYHDGVPSWNWFYPYHYAPYLAELSLTAPIWEPPKFEPSKPCRPLEQLLGVLPPQSSKLVPETYRWLMLSPQSPVIEYYPKSFKTDLNGKKQEWEELVLIPFIETEELRKAMKEAEERIPLSESELERDVLDERVPCYFVPATKSMSEKVKEEEEETCIPTFMPGKYKKKSLIRYIENDCRSPHPQLLTSELRIPQFQPNPFTFPTLFCTCFHTIVKRVQVHIHARKSGDESIVCVFDPLNPDVVINAIRGLLGQSALVGWPYFFPAVVESFCTKEGVIDTSSGGGLIPFKDGGKWFNTQIANLNRDYLKRRAVALDNVDVLVEVRPIAGMSHNLDGSCERQYENGSVLVPLQSIIPDNPDADWLFKERLPSEKLFREGTRAIAIYNGSLRLVEVAEDQSKPDTVHVYPCYSYNSKVSEEIHSYSSEISKRSQPPLKGRWIPFHDLMVRCGLAHNRNAVLQLIGTGEFYPSHKHAGLGIIFQERNGRGPGSSFAPPKIRYGWARYTKAENIFQSLYVSDEVVKLLDEYKKKFPDVYNAIVKADPGKLPDEKSIGKKGDFILRPVAEWVKTLPHASAPIVPAGSSFLPAFAVSKVISTATSTNPPVQTLADKSAGFDIPVSRLVLPHKVDIYPQVYIPAPAMSECNLLRVLTIGDRVVNLLDDGLISFGAIGTVVAVKGQYCDVAFDCAQYGGSDLDSFCPDYHGITRHRIDILPFPIPKRSSRR